ncbi:MAG: HD domain-containing protein [Chloroflexi bacterium]|nr:HD domain-containing protein [Chloroflexota bacterium]
MITLYDVAAFYDDSDPVHDISHVERVLALAERIAAAEGADRMVVRTAVLLHDVSRAEADHEASAVAFAREYLAGHDVHFVNRVVHAIEAHRFSGGPAPQTLEAQVVFDADKLDAIGAVGAARAFAFAGKHGTALWKPVAGEPTAADRIISAHHEYRYKLVRIKERLHTMTARQIAEERHKFMAAFFEQMAREISGEV